MQLVRGTQQIIFGCVSSLSAANILNQELSKIIMQGLKWQPSQHVTILRDTQDGSFELWLGDAIEEEPRITFTPYQAKSTQAK
jgi:hypothetical protein